MYPSLVNQRLLPLFISALLGCAAACTPAHSPDILESKHVRVLKPKLKMPLVSEAKQVDRQQYEARGSKYMVTTQGRAATKAALEIFEQGGNAFDAAAAVSFVLGVERPQSTGLGGGGFMLIRSAITKEVVAVDFREKAPKRAFKNMYLDRNNEPIEGASRNGILASGVPGVVAGVLRIQREFGKLDRSQVMAPAIRLAESGFEVYPHLAESIRFRAKLFDKDDYAKSIYYDEQGQALEVGDRLVQKDLAKTLSIISEKGEAGFYKGRVAAAILDQFASQGGFITREDLNDYQVVYRKPVQSEFRGLEIFSMPPPSSGGTHIIQILNTIENDPIEEWGSSSVRSIHLLSSAMQQAYADRARYMGDSDFVDVPVQGLQSKDYAKSIRRKISMNKARKSEEVFAGSPLAYESPETTHFTIADAEGNIVTSSQTVNMPFGSGVLIKGTGIVMNNQMNDFATKAGETNFFGQVGGHPNLVEAEKRPLSSMSPTIVMKDNKPAMALGTPAGTRIITCVTQTILNYFVHDLELFEAVAAMRIHHQWKPDILAYDGPGFVADVSDNLEKLGYELKQITKPFFRCKIQAIAFEDNQLHGVSDPRGQGLADGR